MTQHFVQPTFLGIGAAKCGTTAIAGHLSEHPEVSMPSKKEMHYFDEQPFNTESLTTYLKCFSPNKAVGEFTPSYLFMKTCRDRIHEALSPGLKFVVILRDPVKRAYSHYCHAIRNWRDPFYRKLGYPVENLLFEEAIGAEPERLQSGKYHIRHLSYFSKGLYADQLEWYFQKFSKKQFFIGLLEDFVQNPQDFMKALCRFLDVDDTYPFKHLDRVVNAQTSGAIPVHVKTNLYHRYRPSIEVLETILNRDLSIWKPESRAENPISNNGPNNVKCAMDANHPDMSALGSDAVKLINRKTSGRIQATDHSFWLKFSKQRIHISKGHFTGLDDEAEKKKLFKQSVGKVCIEVFSRCNRTCGFCPNAGGTRQKQQYLDESLYLNILQDLSDIGYSATFGFHQYNEPLSDPVIFKRIAQARVYLPGARLYTTTNGDFLDKACLAALHDAGLNMLNISVYGRANRPFEDDYILGRIRHFSDTLALPLKSISSVHGHGYHFSGNYQGLALHFHARNFEVQGFDRGGLVSSSSPAVRTSPCFSPFSQLIVNYAGYIKPCCNIYPDSPEHTPYTAGNLYNGWSIFDGYVNGPLKTWRKHMFTFYPDVEVCRTCTRLEFPDLATRRNIDLIDSMRDVVMPGDNNTGRSVFLDTLQKDRQPAENENVAC
ncbi:MAG: sulfotransferase [Thermodesulfobacteriota bacterium]|nr:sulfotransferase [Thermodesulfobacteriota bacterium]